MKKLLSVLLSLSLIFGLGVTSNDYAETINSNDLSSFQSLNGDSQYKPINIKVAKKSKSTSSNSTKKSNAKSKKSNTTKKSTKKTTKKSSTTKKGSTKKNSGATKTTKNNSNSKVGSSTKTKNTSSKNYNADTTQGKIKGNVKSMIYHVPGGAFYDKISANNVVYFDTEQDAINAGYRKAKR